MSDRRAGQPTLRRRALLASAVGATASLAGCMADTEYTIVDVTQESTSTDEPLSFDVAVLDPDIRIGSPGSFELVATNDGDEPLELVSRGVAPFGMLQLQTERDVGSVRVGLWSEEYEASPHVDVRSDGTSVDSDELLTPIEPNETVSFVYEIHGDDVPRDGGVYALAGGWGDDVVTYRRADADERNDDDAADVDGDDAPLSGTGLNPPIHFEIDTRGRIPFV